MNIHLVPISILTIFSRKQVENSYLGMEKRMGIMRENDRLNDEEYEEYKQEKNKNAFLERVRLMVRGK